MQQVPHLTVPANRELPYTYIVDPDTASSARIKCDWPATSRSSMRLTSCPNVGIPNRLSPTWMILAGCLCADALAAQAHVVGRAEVAIIAPYFSFVRYYLYLAGSSTVPAAH
jgi:hypothetical protein